MTLRARHLGSPSISLILWAYNQERFVADAVRSALTQDCPPIDIVISDDCSQDETFAVIQREVSTYRGPHRVRVHRNERNIGLAEHFSRRIMEASSDWVVCAAGDDVSEPHRVSSVLRVLHRFPGLSGVGSGVREIDAAGRFLHEVPRLSHRLRAALPRRLHGCFDRHSAHRDSRRSRLLSFLIEDHPCVLGATAAWRRTLVASYPAIRSGAAEDFSLNFRAALEGGVYIIHEPLVRYRMHESNLWSTASDPVRADEVSLAQNARRLRMYLAGLDQNRFDLASAVGQRVVPADIAAIASTLLDLRASLADTAVSPDDGTAAYVSALLLAQGLRTRGFPNTGRISGSRAGGWMLRAAAGASRAVNRWDLRL
jgi:glycosyltransferase involved in cell wall biosynthesis